MTPTYRSQASTSAPRPSNANAVPTISSGNAKGAGLAETDESIVRVGARSPGCTRSFPVFPRRRGRRLHPRAVSPEGYGAGRAVQCTSVHARAWQDVALPP